MFRELDSNQDKRILLIEIKKKLFGVESREAIIDVLEGADLDQDGGISYKEFMLALIDVSLSLNEKTMKDAFDLLDEDQNGLIDFEEFQQISETR